MKELNKWHDDFVAEQTELMKPSTRAFAERQCALNRARMAREAKGDYGTPLYITN